MVRLIAIPPLNVLKAKQTKILEERKTDLDLFEKKKKLISITNCWKPTIEPRLIKKTFKSISIISKSEFFD